MTTHFTIDTETLSKSANGVVLSLSIVPFDFEEEGVTFEKLLNRGISLKISVSEQVKTHKRKLCKETMDWWADQTPEARQILKSLPTDLSVIETLEAFEQFLHGNGYEKNDSWLFARGTVFDFAKLETLYENAERQIPYKYNMVNDIRTMINCFTGVKDGKFDTGGKRPGFIHHNSLHDAASDSMTMIEIYNMVLNGEL